MPQALSSRDSICSGATGSISDREGESALTQNPTLPPKSCSLSGIHRNTAVCSQDCQGEHSITTDLLFGELSIPGRFVTTGRGKGANEVCKCREGGMIAS